MYYIELKLVVYDKLWDMNTISLADFSVELVLNDACFAIYNDLVKAGKTSLSFKRYV